MSAQAGLSANGLAAYSPLPIDKVRRRGTGELTRCVRNVLHAFGRFDHILLEVANLAVLDAALEIRNSGGADFFDTSADSTDGTLNMRIVFRTSDFRRAITTAAYERMLAYGYSPNQSLSRRLLMPDAHVAQRYAPGNGTSPCVESLAQRIHVRQIGSGLTPRQDSNLRSRPSLQARSVH